MSMLQLKGKQKIILGGAAAFMVCAVIVRYFFMPVATKLSQRRQEIRTEEARLKTSLAIEKRKDRIISEYNQYQRYLEVKNDLSDAEIVTRFLKDIENIAQESGLSIITLNPQNQPDQSQGYRTYTADLRAEATLKQLLTFLHKIQDNQLLIKLDKLSVTAKDEQANMLRLDTTIRIIIP